ncbi:MAG: EAL domain-containing protein [Lachnospiraceae bacterium]|nr:EAL domain-containing protein [Lachnospiraceae bacterium]
MNIFHLLDVSAFHLTAIIVLASVIVFAMLRKHTDRPQNKLFLCAVASLMLQCVFDLIQMHAALLVDQYEEAKILLQIGDFGYFLLHAFLPIILLFYALFVTRRYYRYNNLQRFIGLIPVAIAEFLVLSNPVLHLIWGYNENFRFERHWGELVIYLVSLIYFASAMGILLFRWHAITRRRKLVLCFGIICILAGLVIQMLLPGVMVELFGEAVGILAIMIAVEYDEDLLDSSTSVGNRHALILDLHASFEMHVEFFAISVQLRNPELVRRYRNLSNQELIIEISESLKKVCPRYMIYRSTPATFLILLERTDRGEARAMAERIKNQLLLDWSADEKGIDLKFQMYLSEAPKELARPEDVILMSESVLPDQEECVVLEGADLKGIFDQAKLSEVLRRGIEEHHFKMVYQLIYSADRKKVAAAEALLRLHDPELGDIYPSVFIPVAERIGIIRKIGEYALREVCEFLQSDIPDSLGIRFIGVNLSIIQCTNPDFVPHVSAIVQEYRIKPGRICFEISETAAAVDYRLLAETIRNLKDLGFLFSMDGYGAGYANMYSIFSMDFDLIKLDRSLLYAAQESEEGRVVLRSSAQLIHDLKRKVVVIGVETEEQLEETKTFPVDYFQGHYFSGAETREELEERDVF